MDFNTGGSGGRSPNDPSRPLFGGGPSNPPPGQSGGPIGGSGVEFDLHDPIGSFVRTVVMVLTQPVGFFRSMARRGDFVSPAAFALICAVIAALLTGLLSLPLNLIGGTQGFVEAVLGFFFTLILTPIVVAVVLLMAAGIFHLLVVLLVRPSNAGFEATFRVVCYASVLNLISFLSVIPILGALIVLAASVYAIVLHILGIREVHAATTGKAALVVLVPVAIALFILALLAIVVGAFLFTVLQQ